ncbi:MAG: hypothetical protein IJZ08_05390 [Clostridia bacterium]|nr:hypothetical protein [Clostridia bacterium]
MFANVSHLFWALALIDALYIAAYVLTIVTCPSQAMARGMLLSQVPPMIEHILMSVLLLSACGALEESVFRSV